MIATQSRIDWEGAPPREVIDRLGAGGGLVVAPTKVGYILMATDGAGLERKFDAKQRPRRKPGVVLCASIEQLQHLAQLNEEILQFYRRHWEQDVLLGCILPWRDDAIANLPDDQTRELVMDDRATSCFVIRFGRPAEQIADALWQDGTLTFASSANPSGVGNRGKLAGVGERIAAAADLLVHADDYVSSIQPGKDEHTRHEQGVMISMVDEHGGLVPEQHGQRGVRPVPALIRRGLDYDRIMLNLAESFVAWDYRQGEYY